jgi:hypothetical protein
MQAVNKKVQNVPSVSEKHKYTQEVPVDPGRGGVHFRLDVRKLFREQQGSENLKMPMLAKAKGVGKELRTRTSQDVNCVPETWIQHRKSPEEDMRQQTPIMEENQEGKAADFPGAL